MPESTEIESIVEPVKVSASAPANRRVEDVLAFNPQLTCLEPWFDQLIDAVVQEVSALPGKPTVKATHRRCLRPILANLCKAQRSKQSISIARDKNAYGFPKGIRLKNADKKLIAYPEQLGKKVAGQQYFHVDALSTVNPNIAT